MLLIVESNGKRDTLTVEKYANTYPCHTYNSVLSTNLASLCRQCVPHFSHNYTKWSPRKQRERRLNKLLLFLPLIPSLSHTLHKLHYNFTPRFFFISLSLYLCVCVGVLWSTSTTTKAQVLLFKWPILAGDDEDLRRLSPTTAAIRGGHCSFAGLGSPTAPEDLPPEAQDTGDPV